MKNVLIVFLMAILCMGVYSLVTAHPVHADGVGEALNGGVGAIGEALGATPGGEDQLPRTIGEIIKVILGILGIVVVLIVIYAGFLWMTAGGDSDKAKTARGWIIDAVIGLAIILSAYAITTYVISNLLTATGTG
ncbi:MAG: hypothetical protein V1763_03265 [Parcubacteria group bacterium]